MNISILPGMYVFPNCSDNSKTPTSCQKVQAEFQTFIEKNLQGHNNMELVKKYLEENEHIQI